MKPLNLTIMLILVNTTIFGQNTKLAEQKITALVTNFSAAVETRNIELVAPLLNDNFRVLANRFPTADKTTVLTKESYLSLLTAGKIGGEKRSVTISALDVNEHIASAKVVFESDKAVFTTYQTYILNSNNVWQIASDMPHVKNK